MKHNSKTYDLEDRTFKYASDVRKLIKAISKTPVNFNDINQLLRSSGSVGANYIEANEALSKKDFIHRLKICRKEAKESRYWLKLINIDSNSSQSLLTDKEKLIDESTQLLKIFSSIISKV